MNATKNFQDGFKSFEEAQKVATRNNSNVHLYTMGADGEWFDEGIAYEPISWHEMNCDADLTDIIATREDLESFYNWNVMPRVEKAQRTKENAKKADKILAQYALISDAFRGLQYDEALAVTKNGKSARVIKLHPTHDESKNFSWTLGVPVK